MHKRNLILFIIALFLIIVGVVFFLLNNKDNEPPFTLSNDNLDWTFNGESWQVRGTPPACPEPLVLPAPVDMNLVSGILYPGQERGNDYKPHGGFRFDNRDTNDIEVRAIMDGILLKASKYLEDGEEQILLFYVNDCGLMMMHDHILTLSPKLKMVLDKIPLGKEGDSRTTYIEPKVAIKKGEILATEIGHKDFHGQKNIGIDFGLYDLRKTNGVNYDSSFRARFPMIDEYGTHAVCWLDYLSNEDETIVRNLPASGNEGKMSDYCK